MPTLTATRAAVSVVCAYEYALGNLWNPRRNPRRRCLAKAAFVGAVVALVLPVSVSAQSAPQISTSATDGVFEDRVVVSWTAEDIPAGAYLLITRIDLGSCISGDIANGDTLAVRSRFDTEYSDLTGDPGVAYCYNVAAKDGQDNTLAQSIDDGSRVIFRPTNLRATDGTEEDRVLISWADRSEVETRYEIARGLEEDFVSGVPPAVLADLPENSASYSDTTAVPGTSYYYCATAYDAAGFASQQECDRGLRGFVTPPRNVSASDGQWPNFVRVTWTDASESESFFTVYRIDFQGVVDSVGSVPANTTTFDDPFEGELADGDGIDNDGDGVIDEPGERVAIEYQYCVTATAGGMESVQVCDNGIRGILPAPENVAATVDTYDDRVVITWDDVTDTEDGFQIFRAAPSATDPVRLGSVGTSAETFTDRTALQDQDYSYCVRAFSAVATPDTTYSPSVCATGRRTTVLAPTNVAATDNAFEERINLTWSNPATTAMFFNVYRDDVLIDNVSTSTPLFTDFDAPSNRDLNYCVTALSVRGASISQDVAAKMLETARLDAQAQAEVSPETRASVVFASVSERLTAMSMSSSSQSSAAAIVESAKVCDTGSRRLAAPTSVTATYDEFEDHVQISWTDNSNAERGYKVYRKFLADPNAVFEEIATTSADRTSFGDFTGTAGFEHEYNVRAYDMRGAALGGGLSEPGSDTGFRKLEPPTAVQASDGTSETEVVVTWIDNSRAEIGYVISEYQSAGGIVATVGPNVTTAVIPNTDLNAVLEYEVVAQGNVGSSEPASDFGGTALLRPGNLNASDVYPGKVVIVWTDSSGIETGYNVFRDVGPLDTTTPALASLAPGSTSFVDNSPGTGPHEYCVVTLGPNGSTARACDTGIAPTTTAATGFTPELKFTASSVAAIDGFGAAVAVDGDWAIVGAPLTGDAPPTAAQNQGAAYFYQRSGAQWVYRDFVTAPTAQVDAQLGYSVDISGDYAILGAPCDLGPPFNESGAVYIYERVGTGWQQVQKLIPPDATPTQLDRFGHSVSIDGDWAVVGSPNWDNGTSRVDEGRIHFYKRGSDGTWNRTQSGNWRAAANPGALYGTSVSINGDWVIVGGPGADVYGTDAGSFDLLKREGDFWIGKRLLGGAPGFSAGASVAMGEGWAVVGMPGAPGGKFDVLRRGNDETWPFEFSRSGNSGERLGSSVAIAGDNVVAGTVQNTARAYTYETTWQEADPPIYAGTGSFAGQHTSLAISNNWIMFGSPNSINESGTQTGAVYMSSIMAPPENVQTSDGLFDDRIQVTWTDLSEQEAGFTVYRREYDGTLGVVGTTQPEAELFDDFSAEPGGAFEYCVAAFLGAKTSTRLCNEGWRPANGAISGQVSALVTAQVETADGAGESPVQASTSADQAISGASVLEAAAENQAVDICLDPNPNLSLRFDGAGGFAEAGAFGGIPDGSPYTVEAWVNADPTSFGRILQIGAFDQLSETWTYANPPEGPRVYVGGLEVPIVHGRWNHLAHVYNNGTELVYVDGALAASGQIDPRDCAATGKPCFSSVTVGSESPEGVLPGDEQGFFFQGSVDEIRIWNRARDGASINADMSKKLTGKEEGLVGYWPFDQGGGRIAPDLTATAANARLAGGVYWVEGPRVGECVRSDNNGNYTVEGVRYGEEGTFTVTPVAERRAFYPASKEITLRVESPVENQVDFSDITQFAVSGVVEFEGTNCPVPDVEIKVNGENRTSTETDGTYGVSLFPSDGPTDLYRIEPSITGQDASDVTRFEPRRRDLFVDSDLAGIDFVSTKKRVLRGFFGGSCAVAGDLGTATLKVFTENGCFEQTVPISGTYELELPPQKYLVQVTDVNPANAALAADIIQFFDDLGAREVDLTLVDDTLDFIFRPDISVEIVGLPAPPAQCSTGYTADGRSLPSVPIIGAGQTLPLTIMVSEDYGAGRICPVTNGTVQIFDAIADSASTPKTLAIKDGQANYETIGASPNIFSGSFIEGTDRSFQKSITAVASVEGKGVATATEWAIVEGIRARTATFVSATTGELPLIVLHDPPGSESYSYIEEGTTTCNTWSDMSLISSGGGVDLDFVIGFKTGGQVGFGVTLKIPDSGGGLAIRTRLLAGGETTKSNALEICVTNEKRLSTKGDNTWVGEDLFLGVALNLVFAAADVLTVDRNVCSVDLDETLAGDLDENKPFETTYAFGETHIRSSLIPELRLLGDLVGENTEIGGEIKKEKRSESIRRAIDNWERILDENEKAIQTGVDSLFVENRSFSAGTEYEYSTTSTRDSTWSTGTSTFVDFEAGVGAVLTFGYDQTFLAINETHFRTTHEADSTNGSSQKVGYVLSDGDTGDFFAVDVGEDPRYPGIPVFKTVAGRSSNPWEYCGDLDNPCTQQRDKPEISIFPKIRRNVPEDESAVFSLNLTNASESRERRQYILDVVKQKNPKSAVIGVTGDPIGEELYLIEAGQSQEVTLAVDRGPSQYVYDSLAVIMYPQKEYEIWQADPRQPFVVSDTAYFSVSFEAPCSDISVLRPKDGWGLNAGSIDDSLQIVLTGFDLGGSDAFSVESVGLQYRLAGSTDWLPAVDIPIGVAETLHPDSLGADASSWTTRWLPPREGAYEIRAFSQCSNDEVFSDAITGFVDTKPPKLLGSPTPSDEVLALGSNISATFDEPIDCESISTSGQLQNTELAFVTGPNAGTTVDGISAVCNGETIVINPPNGFDWDAAEGQIMEARFLTNVEDSQNNVRVIKDLAGNPLERNVLEKVAWQFTVRRSAFTWSPADLTVDVDLGSNAEFDAQLVNGRVRLVEYALSGVPGWLSASPPEGTVAPADASAVSFLVTDTLAIGQYTATILAENDGLPARLNLTVDVSCPSPGWVLDPSRFSYSMELTAVLSMEGVGSTDTDDRLGAFVGDELRGTATVDNAGLVRMTIYSPLPAGETVTFRALDASACRLYPATDLILPFVNGTSEGDTGNPIAVDAMNVAPQQSVALSKGWTWFSINRTPSSTDPDDVLATLAPANSDVLKSQTAFSLFDGATRNWIGALNDVVPGKGYMVKLSGPNSLVVMGTPVDPLASPINVTPGWNWIGYHPQGSQPVNDALASLANPDISDLVKSQYGFAQWDGSSWVGSLQSMDPGLGYMIKRANAGTIVYPDVPAGPAVRIAPVRPEVSDVALARLGKEGKLKEDESGQAEDGAVDLSFKRSARPAHPEKDPGLRKLSRDYERAAFNMTVTADVQIDDQPANRPVFVGAFVDDEPRGLARATYVESLGAYRVFLMVYSDEATGETITFRVLDEETERFYDLNQTTPFEADAVLGSPAEPVVLDNRASGKLTDTEELPTEFALRQNYPNPFNPTTTIKYDVPAQSDVRIVLYDVLGRVVQRLVDRNQKAGRYEIVFDASRIASGTYFYRMQAGDFQALHKMIVIK